MSQDELNIEHLPLQNELVKSASVSFSSEDNVLAAVLLGSLAAGKGDRISDADILIFTQNGFHKIADLCFSNFEAGKEVFYCLKVFIMKMRSLKSIFSTI